MPFKSQCCKQFLTVTVNLGLRAEMTPPTKPPFLTPHAYKTGVNLLGMQELSACRVLLPNKLIPEEL